jgi:hypothetical protein
MAIAKRREEVGGGIVPDALAHATPVEKRAGRGCQFEIGVAHDR